MISDPFSARKGPARGWVGLHRRDMARTSGVTPRRPAPSPFRAWARSWYDDRPSHRGAGQAPAATQRRGIRMTTPLIDLRSDTVTRPTAAMRRAMAEAEVGDDVMNEDPTVLKLQERTAELMGKEAALFVPSGTMANQIAVGVHARAGRRVDLRSDGPRLSCGKAAAISRLWGVTPRTGRARRPGPAHGLADLRGSRPAPIDPHYARTRLVCLENTHNRRRWPGPPDCRRSPRFRRMGPGASPWPCIWMAPG